MAGGAITGTWKSPDGTRSGRVSGSIKTEKELQAANAFSKGKDWAFYHGSMSSFAATPCGLTLATDPQDFRLVWKSEELIPGGQGSGCQYLPGLLICSTIGGGASPVVSADGRLFVNYLQPSGTVSNIEKPWGRSASALADLEKLAAEWKTEVGPGVKEKFLLHADDVIVCMWELPNITKEGLDRGHANAPVYVDGVMVMGNQGDTLYGFDANTGKELWKLPGKNSSLAVPLLPGASSS